MLNKKYKINFNPLRQRKRSHNNLVQWAYREVKVIRREDTPVRITKWWTIKLNRRNELAKLEFENDMCQYEPQYKRVFKA